MNKKVLIVSLLSFLLIGSGLMLWAAEKDPAIQKALSSISAKDFSRIDKTLSSDEYEGRAPASKGETLSTQFIEGEFKKLGLKPGNTNSSYFQKVPMVGMNIENTDAKLVFAGKDKKEELAYGDDYMAFSEREAPTVSFDAPLVFAGYGVVAPEYKWNDFKNVNVKGKVLLVLVNDPPIPDPKDPTKLDPHMFGGKAMTYYGRWTYKYEEAARKGAVGCIIIHETEPAAYPWEVVKGSWSGEQFTLVQKDKGASKIAIEAWITRDRAVQLFKLAGKDFDAMKKEALSREFKPVDLGVTASLTLNQKLRRIESNNVIAKIEGSDAAGKNEYVIYTAHWDHLGMRETPQGKEIFHGAVDNASGVAGLIQLAKAFTQLPTPPRRSVVFLSVTAEEKGLLGSQYYATHPIYPLNKTAAVINMDGVNVLGKTKDFTIIGYGQSSLDDLVKKFAARQGRVVKSDPTPEHGGYYRSDHFSFAKVGVPALDPKSGVDYVGHPAGWGLEQQKEYTAKRYHKPADLFDPNWNLSGAVQDLQLLFEVGNDVADSSTWPEWSAKSEFRAKRAAMMK
ncbi:MAG: M28 family metallopeptidase [Acidobacteriia bacterium]|nr:M28 family metallopeptidase [Terriglobia bacterium]